MLRRTIWVQVRNDLRPWFSFEITGPSLRSWYQSLVFIPGGCPDFRSGALKGNIFAATGDTHYKVKYWRTIHYTSPRVVGTPLRQGYRRRRHFTKHWTSTPCTLAFVAGPRKSLRTDISAYVWQTISQLSCWTKWSIFRVKILRDAHDANKYTGLELALRIAMDTLEEN